MATITVTNLNDSGAGSLRQALADAYNQAGADTIVFAENLSGGTIRLASFLPVFEREGVFVQGDIDGDDVPDITISGDTDADGSGDTQLLRNGGADVTFNGFRFDKGRAENNEDAIINNQNGDVLTISNSYITDSVVDSTRDLAGTILNAGDLTLDNVLVDNAVVNLNGASGSGAAGLANAGGSTVALDRFGVTGEANGGAGTYAVLGIVNYGAISGGVLAIGDGDTGDDGTGLVNRGAGTGTVTLGIAGTDDADTLNFASATTEQIVLGFAGDDDIDVGSADDTVFGGDGGDEISGGAGEDSLNGGLGDDVISAGDDGDFARGGGGDDSLSGGGGGDRLAGDVGDDTMSGGDGADTMFGGLEDDLLRGEAGAD
ncbi:MAG: calcium-binding protein, partial [Pseudomonadota bacterium]